MCYDGGVGLRCSLRWSVRPAVRRYMDGRTKFGSERREHFQLTTGECGVTNLVTGRGGFCFVG